MYSPGHPLSSGSYDYEVMQSQQISRKDVPQKNGHWDRKAINIGPPPVLPENPTEQQRAEHQAADQKWQDRYYSVSHSWVPDPKPEEKSASKSPEAQARQHPPMLPLPRRTARLPKINVHRHEAQCSVCRHPDRQIIEDEFVNWASPRATAKDFGIDFRAIYRHARAYNLVALRNRNIRGVLSLILERAEHIATPTADAIIRGVKAFTRINDDGQWIEPASRVVFSTAGNNSHHSSNHPDEALDVSPEHLESSDPIRIRVLSDRFRRRHEGRRAEPKNPSSPNAASSPSAKVRHAANLATSQLAENAHRRLRYPETHFAVHRSRKIKTKANKFCAPSPREK